jgi:homoaconitate hydratase
VAGPNEVKTITPLPDIEARKVKIDKAYLLSCVNGRLEDIEDAAKTLRGRRVAPGVRMYVAAASAEIEDDAKRRGYWKDLLDAGAIPLPPGCGPCIGLGEGILEDGEVAVSATNRNFKGRMGSRSAEAYLASPAVVAESAAAGYIKGPEGAGAARLSGSVDVRTAPAPARETIAIREGFPDVIEGALLLVPKDNLNTDGIFGKEYTYKDDLTPEEMGKAAMLNYDPGFQKIAEEGDILVGGWNFGSGSSREQAATALKYRGLQMVIAGSFSQTYKRNAFNNGYIVVECPGLVNDLRKRFEGDGRPTIRTKVRARADFASSEITADGKTYPFSPLREVAQELVALGGFEAVLRKRLGGA